MNIHPATFFRSDHQNNTQRLFKQNSEQKGLLVGLNLISQSTHQLPQDMLAQQRLLKCLKYHSSIGKKSKVSCLFSADVYNL